jgi:hypothetical protein
MKATKIEISKQIKDTLKELHLKKLDGEPIIDQYIDAYENADTDSSDKNLKRLLNKSRGYMETSSNWNQKFLNEMSKTEKLIKSYI